MPQNILLQTWSEKKLEAVSKELFRYLYIYIVSYNSMYYNPSILYINSIFFVYLTGNFKLAYIYCVSELRIREM